MFLYSFDFQIITQQSSFNASTGRVWGYHARAGSNENARLLARGTTLTKNPPPFRLASLINRNTHTFKTPTHHRKTQTFPGQTEPRNRKSRKVRKSGVARKSSALAGLGHLARASSGENEVPFGRLFPRFPARAGTVVRAVSFSPGRGGQTEWRWGAR